MKRAALLLLSGFLSWIGGGDVRSATIERLDDGSLPQAIFALEGAIEANDGERFVNKVLGVDAAIVVLSSYGGEIGAAIKIGQAIRLKGFQTLVLEDTVCASACGLIWLAGQPRLMAPNAQIGFHAAYDVSNGAPRERGAANAIVGAYLGALGFSQRTIIYVTAPAPDEMQWLTLADASMLGIEVQPFDAAPGPQGGPLEGRPDEIRPSTPGLARPRPDAFVGENPPQFRSYPADDFVLRNRSPVDLSSDEAWMYRTRLRNAAKQEPNFAGHYVIAEWGCGTTCVMGAAIDVASGRVTFLPASACCWTGVDANFKPLEFRLNSRLFVMAGLLNEQGKMGAHFFVFDGRAFNLLKTIETQSDFGASLSKESNPSFD